MSAAQDAIFRQTPILYRVYKIMWNLRLLQTLYVEFTPVGWLQVNCCPSSFQVGLISYFPPLNAMYDFHARHGIGAKRGYGVRDGEGGSVI